MGHAGNPDEFLEIFGYKLRAVVGNYPWARSRVLFFGSFEDDFNISFGHLLSDLPMDDGATAAIQEAAQVVEGATDVEVRDIDVPVLVRQQWLNESRSF